jgi:hypothetical protein
MPPDNRKLLTRYGAMEGALARSLLRRVTPRPGTRPATYRPCGKLLSSALGECSLGNSRQASSE